MCILFIASCVSVVYERAAEVNKIPKVLILLCIFHVSLLIGNRKTEREKTSHNSVCLSKIKIFIAPVHIVRTWAHCHVHVHAHVRCVWFSVWISRARFCLVEYFITHLIEYVWMSCCGHENNNYKKIMRRTRQKPDIPCTNNRWLWHCNGIPKHYSSSGASLTSSYGSMEFHNKRAVINFD